jgi:hypothetical protein
MQEAVAAIDFMTTDLQLTKKTKDAKRSAATDNQTYITSYVCSVCEMNRTQNQECRNSAEFLHRFTERRN